LGTRLHHEGRDRQWFSAEVVATGIALRDKVYRSPSAAAKHVTHRNVNGWTYWRLDSGQTLDSLRQ
jgi:hypothetical protein